MYGETFLMFPHSPLKPTDAENLKGIALKSPYRKDDTFTLTICPLPHCGTIDASCQNITISIPDQDKINNIEEIPKSETKSNECGSEVLTEVQKVPSFMVQDTSFVSSSFDKIKTENANSKSRSSNIVVSFIPNLEMERTIVVLSDWMGEVKSRFVCPIDSFLDAAALTEKLSRDEEYLLSFCSLIEQNGTENAKLMIILVTALCILLIPCVIIYLIIKPKCFTRKSSKSFISAIGPNLNNRTVADDTAFNVISKLLFI